MQSLTAHDPDNKNWSETYLHALELRAAARLGAGKLALASDNLVLAQPLVDAFTRVASSNREALRDVLETLTLRVALAWRMGDHATALRAAHALQAIYPGQVAPDPPEGIGRNGLSEVVVDMVAADAGRPASRCAGPLRRRTPCLDALGAPLQLLACARSLGAPVAAYR